MKGYSDFGNSDVAKAAESLHRLSDIDSATRLSKLQPDLAVAVLSAVDVESECRWLSALFGLHPEKALSL